MTNRSSLLAGTAGLLACTAILVSLTGCGDKEPAQVTVVQAPAPAPAPVAEPALVVMVPDDYDYYPGYETYYSRNRREYIYREGNVWVRRPTPRGVSLSLFMAAPSIRVDFHDAPERHHDTVIRSYPRSWKRPDRDHDGKDDHRKDGDKH